MFQTIVFDIIVIGFYSVSVWQYRNPTKAFLFSKRKAFKEEPIVDEA